MCAFATDSSKARLAASASSRAHRAGFTLIELLIVVVIIGILTAIAIPKFASTKEQAYVAKMKADLRNLAAAQEVYSADNGSYYGGVIPNAALVYNPSSGVTITMTEGTAGGWAAVATSSVTPRKCALFIGNASAPAPATADGLIACTS